MIPWWGYIMGLVLFGLQYAVYRLGDALSRGFGTINYAWCPKIPVIDDAIPIVPFFAIIYLLSYALWIIGPIAASLTSKKNIINYIVGYTIALFVGMIIFIAAPSSMDRQAAGLITQMNEPGFLNSLLKLIYGNDGGQYGFNLFPSFHCLVSIYCYFGVRKQKEIPLWYKITVLVLTFFICLSTVFTKQHYFIDIPAGLGIAIIVYIIVEKIDIGSRWLKARENKKLSKQEK